MRRGLLQACYDLLQTVHANQLVLAGKLNLLLQQEATMAIDLTSITAEVTNNTSVTQSVLALVNNFGATDRVQSRRPTIRSLRQRSTR